MQSTWYLCRNQKGLAYMLQSVSWICNNGTSDHDAELPESPELTFRTLQPVLIQACRNSQPLQINPHPEESHGSKKSSNRTTTSDAWIHASHKTKMGLWAPQDSATCWLQGPNVSGPDSLARAWWLVFWWADRCLQDPVQLARQQHESQKAWVRTNWWHAMLWAHQLLVGMVINAVATHRVTHKRVGLI